jgi:hypothetical protein
LTDQQQPKRVSVTLDGDLEARLSLLRQYMQISIKDPSERTRAARVLATDAVIDAAVRSYLDSFSEVITSQMPE